MACNQQNILRVGVVWVFVGVQLTKSFAVPRCARGVCGVQPTKCIPGRRCAGGFSGVQLAESIVGRRCVGDCLEKAVYGVIMRYVVNVSLQLAKVVYNSCSVIV